jgi:hypothetical protein
MNRHRVIALCAGLSIAAAAIAAVMIPSVTAARAPASARTGRALDGRVHQGAVSSRFHTPSSLVLKRFSLLRTARATSVVPAVISRLAVAGHSATYGLDPSDARMATLPGSVHVWLIPGATGSCMLVSIPGPLQGEGGGCNPNLGRQPGAGAVQSGMMEFTFNDANAEWVIGLVPDGAQVELWEADGATVTPAIVDNAFEAIAPVGDEFDQVAVSNAGKTVWEKHIPPIDPNGP